MRTQNDKSILNLLYRGTTTIQDFCWDAMTTTPILSLITAEEINYIHKLILSPRYSGNNKYKMEKIDEVMHFRGFSRFAGGTNRLVYEHPAAPNAVFKVAIDAVGINDNPAEFYNQKFLKPYCCKVFECSPCGTIASFERVERITTFEEFYTIADDYFYILSRVIIGKYVMDDIGIDYFMNIGIRKGCHPVILDFPYLFELDGRKLECGAVLEDGSVCRGDIDYDHGFNKLMCKKCGRVYRARDLAKPPKESHILLKNKGGARMNIRLMRGNEVLVHYDTTVERDFLSPNDPEIGKSGIRVTLMHDSDHVSKSNSTEVMEIFEPAEKPVINNGGKVVISLGKKKDGIIPTSNNKPSLNFKLSISGGDVAIKEVSEPEVKHETVVEPIKSYNHSNVTIKELKEPLPERVAKVAIGKAPVAEKVITNTDSESKIEVHVTGGDIKKEESSFDRAQRLINEYLYDEFGSKDNLHDITNIALASTRVGENNEYQIDVVADLKNLTVKTIIDAEEFKVSKFDTIEEMNDNFLDTLNFDDLTFLTKEELDKLSEIHYNESNPEIDQVEIIKCKPANPNKDIVIESDATEVSYEPVNSNSNGFTYAIAFDDVPTNENNISDNMLCMLDAKFGINAEKLGCDSLEAYKSIFEKEDWPSKVKEKGFTMKDAIHFVNMYDEVMHPESEEDKEGDTEENLLRRAIDIINAYYHYVYQTDDDDDFSDLANIDLGYADINNGEHDIHVAADLENYKIILYFDDKLFKQKEFKSLSDMVNNGLVDLDFDKLVELSDDELKEIYSLEDKDTDKTDDASEETDSNIKIVFCDELPDIEEAEENTYYFVKSDPSIDTSVYEGVTDPTLISESIFSIFILNDDVFVRITYNTETGSYDEYMESGPERITKDDMRAYSNESNDKDIDELIEAIKATAKKKSIDDLIH